MPIVKYLYNHVDDLCGRRKQGRAFAHNYFSFWYGHMRSTYAILLIVFLFPCNSFGENLDLQSSRYGLLKTGADNSLRKQKRLFKRNRNGFVSRSKLINIHAHFTKNGTSTLKNFTYTGDMRVTNRNGGVGVTFYSDYPKSDSYYRLRAFPGSDFHIAPHGTSITEGDAETGITPLPKRWYSFKIRVSTAKNETRIRAKVWRSKKREPRGWQINCVDSSETRLKRGKPGLWSMAEGRKQWRNLELETR